MNSKFFVHNIYMAEIADCMINDKIPLTEDSKIMFAKNAKYQEGVREIVGLYLLIPYINNARNKLKFDNLHEQISVFSDEYIAFYTVEGIPIKIKNLRDTMCHSFVSCELDANSKYSGESLIVFDDRAIFSCKEHNKMENSVKGNKCVLVKSSNVLSFLKKAYKEILIKFNCSEDENKKII